MQYLQASPIGMASASQADFGGSDSRRLLQTMIDRIVGQFSFLKNNAEIEINFFNKVCKNSLLFYAIKV